MSSMLTIQRTKQFANKLRAINIFVNEEKVVSILDGQVENIELKKGENTVYAQIDRCKTPPLQICAKESSTHVLELGSELKGWKTFLASYRAFFDSKNYIYLKQHNSDHK